MLPLGNIQFSPPNTLKHIHNFHHGTNSHMCHDHSLFSEIYPSSPVQLPNGNTLSIEGIRSCVLSKSLTLSNVLFILHFKFNLLFVPQLITNIFCIVFFFCEKIFLSRSTIGKANWSGWFSQWALCVLAQERHSSLCRIHY